MSHQTKFGTNAMNRSGVRYGRVVRFILIPLLNRVPILVLSEAGDEKSLFVISTPKDDEGGDRVVVPR
jgi:hypothetical protein